MIFGLVYPTIISHLVYIIKLIYPANVFEWMKIKNKLITYELTRLIRVLVFKNKEFSPNISSDYHLIYLKRKKFQIIL